MPGSLTETINLWAEISTRRTMYEFGHFMRARGISMPQIMVLMHLNHAGHCAVTDIGRHLDISKPAASQLIQRLVEQELLERRENQEDRRIKEVFLTEKGRRLIVAATAARSGWIETLVKELPDDKESEIMSVLHLLIQAANQVRITGMAREDPS